MKILKCLIVLLIFAISGCNVLQYADTPSSTHRNNSDFNKGSFNREPGKCYAKCLVKDGHYQEEMTYAIYTGDEKEEDVDIELVEVVLHPGGTNWVKKKADRNCLSADPNDCLVWCLVETKREVVELKVLADTSQSTNYEMQTAYKKEQTSKGESIEWREVLCANKINENIIKQIRANLNAEGYALDLEEKGMDTALKAALSAFQKDNNFPVGQLDMEVLDVLGVVVD